MTVRLTLAALVLLLAGCSDVKPVLLCDNGAGEAWVLMEGEHAIRSTRSDHYCQTPVATVVAPKS